MQREITAFHRDEVGDWVAELGCLHSQHIRHQPPLRPAAWVTDEAGRRARIGSTINCPLCDRAELPDDLRVVRTTATWDEATLPAALTRSHRVASGVWGRIRVLGGELRFLAATDPPTDVVLVQGDTQPIPPDVEHRVELRGSGHFHVEFLKR